jgi:hypothetical protein
LTWCDQKHRVRVLFLTEVRQELTETGLIYRKKYSALKLPKQALNFMVLGVAARHMATDPNSSLKNYEHGFPTALTSRITRARRGCGG